MDLPVNPILAAAERTRMAAQGEGKGPTKEIGTLNEINSVAYSPGVPPWSRFVGEILEKVPELRWRPYGKGSVETYHTMRNDAQIQGMYLGCTLPIRRYNWYIEPNGSKAAVYKKLASDYNLPVRGQEDQPKKRARRRFDFQDHLRHALLALLYGHMFFEQVGEVDDRLFWHMTRLAPRMPNTIYEIRTEPNGDLQAVVQRPYLRTVAGGAPISLMPEPIGVDRLAAYVWEREGGNWAGRSMLRGIYKNWLLKDTVLRVGAINIERAGGVPVITGPKGATPQDLAELGKMARQFRVGEGSGGAIPNGAELNLARAAGGEEAVNFIKLQNEEMGRAWLMMFMNLGQAGSHGSYAMSNTMVDYFLSTQEAIANWFVDNFNRQVIELDVDNNWGPNEQAPLLGFTRLDNRQMAMADLVDLIDAGAVTIDDELESWIREEYQMPRRDPEAPARSRPTPQEPSPVQARGRRSGRSSRGGSPPSAPSVESQEIMA